jgi:hypothetical protein
MASICEYNSKKQNQLKDILLLFFHFELFKIVRIKDNMAIKNVIISLP